MQAASVFDDYPADFDKTGVRAGETLNPLSRQVLARRSRIPGSGLILVTACRLPSATKTRDTRLPLKGQRCYGDGCGKYYQSCSMAGVQVKVKVRFQVEGLDRWPIDSMSGLIGVATDSHTTARDSIKWITEKTWRSAGGQRI